MRFFELKSSAHTAYGGLFEQARGGILKKIPADIGGHKNNSEGDYK